MRLGSLTLGLLLTIFHFQIRANPRKYVADPFFSHSARIPFLSCANFRYPLARMTSLPLSELLGATVYDPSGAAGKVREVTVAPQEDRDRIATFIVKTKSGNRVLPYSAVTSIDANIHTSTYASDWPAANGSEGQFLLERDLLDQQVIDINGRKVVRVNDVDLGVEETKSNGTPHAILRVQSVDIGARGAIRRLLRGLAPRAALDTVLLKISPRTIPWSFVDLIETDPARRIKLKTSYDGLASLHPADIADIVEDLAPNEREAVFRTLDEDVAAETLEELEPSVQRSIVESLDSERAADIVEEMDPGAAADLLGELSDERSEAILEEMEPEERHEVEELLEFHEDSAAGRMTTEFVWVGVEATVADAVQALRLFDGDAETVTEIYLLDPKRVLRGSVPLARMVVAQPASHMSVLAEPRVLSCPAEMHQSDVAELFDKYNLHSLPVIEAQGRMVGVVHSDQVISYLLEKL